MENWLEALGEHTFVTQLIALTELDAVALKLRYHMITKEPSDISDTMTPEEVDCRLERLQNEVQLAIDETLRLVKSHPNSPYASDGVFIKLSSRSAKDSPLYNVKLEEHYPEYMRQTKDRSLNTKTKALLHSATRLLKVDQAQTAFEFFTKSERISEDISLALTQRGDAFQMNIVLRQWVDIDIDMEFRGFVCNGRLNALSQYNHIVTFDRLRMDSEYQSDIQQRSES